MPPQFLGDAWFHHYGWVTPVDDNRALRFGIAAAEATSEEARQRLVEMYSSRAKALNPADFVHELFTEQTVPDELAPQLLATQDYVAIKGQGTIYDRSQERLGQSDAGIALFRRICFHEMAALAEGRPTKLWRKLDADIEMPIQSPEPADT